MVYPLLLSYFFVFFFFKQKTAYEMRISDWSSDVCSSDLSSEPASPCDAASPCINWVVTSAVPPAVASSNAATKGHLGMVSLLEIVEAYRTGLPAKFRRHGWL